MAAGCAGPPSATWTGIGLPIRRGPPAFGGVGDAEVIFPTPYESPGAEFVASQGDVTIEVRVELKPGVFDAEADSISRSLAQLGLEGLRSVRVARTTRLTFQGIDPAEARRRAELAVERLLANPVIHRVELAEVRG